MVEHDVAHDEDAAASGPSQNLADTSSGKSGLVHSILNYGRPPFMRDRKKQQEREGETKK
jgi:hypothetical protein